jgi:basic membrane protein A and related proteins
MMSKRLLAAGVVAALALAACGDDDDDEAAPSATTEAPSDGTTAATTAAPATTAAAPGTTAAGGGGADGSDITVGLTYDLLGRGDQSFNDSAAAGMDRAKADFGVTVNELTPTDASARGTDMQLQAENADLVIGVGFSFAPDLATVAEDGTVTGGIAVENPDVLFAVVDDALMNFNVDPPAPLVPNAAGLVFSEEQGSYLVGVAAALKSTTGKIGFIGGVSGIGLIEKFEAGYIAGAKSINPDIQVTSQYITEFPDFDGFESPDRAKEIATAMYSEGADIVYAAAGLSGSGMFQAAAETSEATGTKVWGIGVDSDQYNTVDPAVRDYVLTSMIKRVDVAVYNITADVVNGTFEPGEQRYDLAADGVGYATSGGFVDDIVDQLESAKAAIIDGSVVVPTDPTMA